MFLKGCYTVTLVAVYILLYAGMGMTIARGYGAHGTHVQFLKTLELLTWMRNRCNSGQSGQPVNPRRGRPDPLHFADIAKALQDLPDAGLVRIVLLPHRDVEA